MPQWRIQQFKSCSVHVLAEVSPGIALRYGYSGFVCAHRDGDTFFVRMQRFHHIRPDFKSAEAAIAAGMCQGRAIAEQWFANSLGMRDGST